MVAGVQERALACMDAFPPQAVANTMWALAHLCRGQAPRADVLAALLDRIALTGAAGFQPIAIANVLWSMAVLRRQVPTAVWCALLPRARSQLLAFRPQTVSNILWAVATLRVSAHVDLDVCRAGGQVGGGLEAAGRMPEVRELCESMLVASPSEVTVGGLIWLLHALGETCHELLHP